MFKKSKKDSFVLNLSNRFREHFNVVNKAKNTIILAQHGIKFWTLIFSVYQLSKVLAFLDYIMS